jgi:hypothetical protein
MTLQTIQNIDPGIRRTLTKGYIEVLDTRVFSGLVAGEYRAVLNGQRKVTRPKMADDTNIFICASSWRSKSSATHFSAVPIYEL